MRTCATIYNSLITAVGLSLVVVSGQLSADVNDHSLEASAQTLTNKHVEWGADLRGLHPTPHGPAKVLIDANDRSIAPALLPQIRDPERFAAAHVVLAYLYGLTAPAQDSSASWFGIDVQLVSTSPDETVTEFAGNDLDVLHERWRRHIFRKSQLQQALEKLSNEQLTWDQREVGLSPSLSGPAGVVLELADTKAVPQLRPLLRDENRYAVVHVLLTKLVRPPRPFENETGYWYTMQVQRTIDGQVTYGDDSNRHAVDLFWIVFQNSTRRE